MTESDQPRAGPDASGETDRPRSVFDDFNDLIDDGRTFLDAELTFQKTRLAYAGGRGRAAAIAALAALVFAIFGLFAVIVGLIIGLTPLITAWGATAVVGGLMFLAAAICAVSAGRNVRRARNAFAEENDAA